MSVVSAVRAAAPASCQVQRCASHGCSVSLAGAPRSRVVVKMDCEPLGLPGNQSRCDFVFAADGKVPCVVPIELKSGGVRASTVKAQLQAGANWAEAHVVPQGVKLVPILAFKKVPHRLELNQLRRAKIRFGGKDWQAETVRCGESIVGKLKG